MFNKSKFSLIGLLFMGMLALSNFTACTKNSISEEPYKPTWNSLRNHSSPEWLKDAKFGIYTHWGVWSVPAFARVVRKDDPPHPYKGISLKQVKSSKTMFDSAEERLEVIESLITLRTGRDGTWYPFNMYREGTAQYNYHVKTYGPPEEFGYKDFIPMFTAEKFDANEWAELFKEAGAQFAGPVAEHHDGFSMWDSKLTKWDAAEMGPKRDVVGELEVAIKNRGMKFVTAFHHSMNWWFYPHWKKEYDTSNPEYSGLYGSLHNLEDKPGVNMAVQWEEQDEPNIEFLEQWKNKLAEVVDNYQPDLIWFDFALEGIRENYRLEFLAYYFNKAMEWDKEVEVTYKNYDIPPVVGVTDLEMGTMDKLTYHGWLTDTSVDEQGSWAYVQNVGYKSVNQLVDNLIDRVSKNGYLLLNVGPKPDGTIPKEAKNRLLGIGEWLKVNGEAIYGTTPWSIYGEGPTTMSEGGHFSEEGGQLQYTAEDIRFTAKNNVLYAICLEWPGEQVNITSLNMLDVFPSLYKSEINTITMLGSDQELNWLLTKEGLTINSPDTKPPSEHAYVFKIIRNY